MTLHIEKGNWWLRLLALALALVIYYTIHNDTAGNGKNHKSHDRTTHQSR